MGALVGAVTADAPTRERFLRGQGRTRGKEPSAVVHHGRVTDLGSLALVCVISTYYIEYEIICKHYNAIRR